MVNEIWEYVCYLNLAQIHLNRQSTTRQHDVHHNTNSINKRDWPHIAIHNTIEHLTKVKTWSYHSQYQPQLPIQLARDSHIYTFKSVHFSNNSGRLTKENSSKKKSWLITHFIYIKVLFIFHSIWIILILL